MPFVYKGSLCNTVLLKMMCPFTLTSALAEGSMYVESQWYHTFVCHRNINIRFVIPVMFNKLTRVQCIYCLTQLYLLVEICR